jgi:hypothetical protein
MPRQRAPALTRGATWALVHYVMLDDQMRKEQRLAEFGELISSNVDEMEAARQAFSDLKQLERKVRLPPNRRGRYFFSYTSRPPTKVCKTSVLKISRGEMRVRSAESTMMSASCPGRICPFFPSSN